MAETENTQDNVLTVNGKPIHSIHFIGIGGVGMSGIARVAHDQGVEVSGSDLRRSKYTDQLEEAGVKVFIGHDAANLSHNPDIVVVSTAILDNNVELRAAKEKGLPIWHRAKMLSFLGRELDVLAVAGTHGKTTTSSMLAYVVDELGLDPTFLIGGIVRSYDTNAHSGSGRYYVVEADESDKSFTYLNPYAVLVTNVEPDHLDHYSDLNEIRAKFAEFISSVPEEGTVVVCGDDEPLVELARGCGHPFTTYGAGEGCDVRVSAYRAQGVGCAFTVTLANGAAYEVALPQNPGEHYALDAAGVIALVDALGLDVRKAAEALAGFRGVRRRFDLVGEYGGVTIVDDYAHHPTEIAATIAAAHDLDFKRVIVLFQPHRYSRLPLFAEVLHDEFGRAFDLCDQLIFTDVYPAGETPVPGVNGKTFLNVVLEHEGHPEATYVHHRVDVVPTLARMVREGDLVITMGAGDVTAVGGQLLAELKRGDR